MLLGLIGFPHGTKRISLPHGSRPNDFLGRPIKRLACNWMTEKWLLQRLGNNAQEQLQVQAQATPLTLSALVYVRPGATDDGVLSDWCDEERLLMEYNRFPKHAFSLQVLQAASLAAPAEV